MLTGPQDYGCMANGMRHASSEKPLVHVVDDDASMRGALEGLFDSAGLRTLAAIIVGKHDGTLAFS